jgi:hypothetical protein
MVGIGLVTGETQCLITIEAFPWEGGGLSKFDVVDGQGVVFHRGRILPQNQVSTVTCTVRRGIIIVESNGRAYGQYEGDFKRLSVHKDWAVNEKGLFICAVGKGLGIESIVLEPLSSS